MQSRLLQSVSNDAFPIKLLKQKSMKQVSNSSRDILVEIPMLVASGVSYSGPHVDISQGASVFTKEGNNITAIKE